MKNPRSKPYLDRQKADGIIRRSHLYPKHRHEELKEICKKWREEHRKSLTP